MPIKSDFDRPRALTFLKAAFWRAADKDYAHGHIHNEEDVRASTYRYARNALDRDPTWRLFTNLSAFSNRANSNAYFRPDISIFHWKPKAPSPRIEIFAEIKHWPNESKIIADLKKLARLREIYTPEHPDIAFFGILGHGFNHISAAKLTVDLRRRFKANIWLIAHHGPKGPLYAGPWSEAAKLDPWRARLKHLHGIGERTSRPTNRRADG
ncbi:MAG: hypothetical protein WC765_05840 [Phycisphaerae bacterium]|jgi:hypothetical protein